VGLLVDANQSQHVL